MNMRRGIAFGLLAGGLGLILVLSGQGYSQPPTGDTLVQRLAKKWNMKEAEVSKKLQDLGQEVEKELSNGRTADVPGLGTLRVVRVQQHREIKDRKAVTVKTNTVDLRPSGGLAAAANSPGARPVETVLPNDYFFLKTGGPKKP